jgi:hypothetical protein
MRTTKKLTGKENLTKYAYWLGPVGPTNKENHVKMNKKYCFRYLFETVRIRIGIKHLDPDLYQKGLDPQHRFVQYKEKK